MGAIDTNDSQGHDFFSVMAYGSTALGPFWDHFLESEVPLINRGHKHLQGGKSF